MDEVPEARRRTICQMPAPAHGKAQNRTAATRWYGGGHPGDGRRTQRRYSPSRLCLIFAAVLNDSGEAEQIPSPVEFCALKYDNGACFA